MKDPTIPPVKKTMKQKLGNTVKYSGSSVVLGAATAQIIVFFFPQINPIAAPVQALLTFFINLALVKFNLVNE